VKGLEGSCDLACSRTAIISFGDPSQPNQFQRFLVNPRDYGFESIDPPLDSLETLVEQLQGIIAGEENELSDAAIFNGGFYLWRCGVVGDLEAAFTHARTLLQSGQAIAKLQQLRADLGER
jgi:anthranilate phosphoribosyltransferase